ncbi:MAG: hypothetical protein KGI38_02405 [Thaumarchaeota archaeon]|nr:hypothetical protein [Nitrososphaerota archaeon]
MSNSSFTSTEDEVKTVVALGVVGSILVYFQLRQAHAPVLPIARPVVSPLTPIIHGLVNIDLFLFSVYLLFLIVALGVNILPRFHRSAQRWKEYADAYFLLGSVMTIVLVLTVIGYVWEEWTYTYGPGELQFFLYLAFVLMSAVFAIGIITVKRRGT